MTGVTVEYYLDILKRVRKGKPPADDEGTGQELLAFDAVYALSLLYDLGRTDARDADLELTWSDEKLLDCGKLAGLLAHEMATDEAWNEIKTIFEPYVVRKIEGLSDIVEKAPPEVYDPPTGGFAFSEYVCFKEMLDRLATYRAARANASHERLMRTMEDMILGNPTVNGVFGGTI